MPLIAVYKYQPKRNGQPNEVTKGRRAKSPVWYLKWRDANGRQHKETTRSRDERVAEQLRKAKEYKLLNDAHGGIFPVKTDATRRWSAVVKEFISVRTSRPRTLETYRYCGLAFEREMKDPVVVKVDGRLLEQFVASRYQLGNKATTINKELRHVGAMLSWAAKQGYIELAPKWRDYRCKEDLRAPVVVPGEVYRKTLAALDDRRLVLQRQSTGWWKMFLTLLHWTGCRTGELLGLERRAVNLRLSTLTVVAETSKSRRERTLPLPRQIVVELQDWFRTAGVTDQAAKVFPWAIGLRQLYDEWKQIEQFAEVPHHLLKHYRSSRACVLIAVGEPTLVVRDWLGHSSVVTLERYYANAGLRLTTAADNLQRHLQGGTIPGTTEVV